LKKLRQSLISALSGSSERTGSLEDRTGEAQRVAFVCRHIEPKGNQRSWEQVQVMASIRDRILHMSAEDMRTEAVGRGLQLEYLTVGWNVLEGLIAVASGLIAGSIALVGFGIDSMIEVSSGTVLLWRLGRDRDVERREKVEALSLKLVGCSFLALAAYVAYEALTTLFLREAPQVSYVGIGLGIVSLIVMPLLARAKRRVASQIGSHALEADSRQTDFCAYLSGILLVGLVLNASFGWWWADPVVALVMTPIIAKEGIEALHGERCRDNNCS
jgi:divalent metal cation (Fe/Co/Zn/Cd) transporter